MSSRFDPVWVTDLERERNAMAASRRFSAWAEGEGSQPLAIALERRDWALIVAVAAHHAALLTVQGGDPDILNAIAGSVAHALADDIGRAEADRLLQLLEQMITGMG